jgi:hypothetical protein
MASVILFCRKCSTGYASVGEIPITCPSCGEQTTWSTAALLTVDGWKPTRDDRRFLKAGKIAPE